jgi:hypothetical protein
MDVDGSRVLHLGQSHSDYRLTPGMASASSTPLTFWHVLVGCAGSSWADAGLVGLLDRDDHVSQH